MFLAASLASTGLYAQSSSKSKAKLKTQKAAPERSVQDTSTVVIPMEKSFKAKIKKQSKVVIVPAKALQGSEPAQPEKPVPKQ